MRSVGPRAHLKHADDRGEIEFAVKMREQFIMARVFPAQRLSQQIGIDLDQEQPGLAEKVLPRRFRQLRSGRKMDKTVARIGGDAAGHPLPLGLAPGRSGANFVDPAHLLRSPACRLFSLWVFPEFPALVEEGRTS